MTRLPLRIERNAGSAPVKAKSVGLEMSVDDGANWRKIPVVRTGSGWSASVPNPGEAGFGTLRAVVTDAEGIGLTQTITRAYAIG
ncbi:hypothetical protein AB0L53_46720 [Nonomuraea sp. NPDC052129]|uniref:hypothetical protein n=1 Tax=Nonomuraea sp. NPDC052129 TaxID=3154651 RepID=UPI00341BC6C3